MKKFKDYPEFTPNISPKQVFNMGSFGGTYYRPIYSSITNKKYKSKDVIKEYPKSWFKNLDIDKMVISSTYDKNINKYKVVCGSSLEVWEKNKWIVEQDPYGWFQWYCRFYQGRRSDDDERQIDRWKKIVGPNGRFRRMLMNMIIKRKTTFDDYTVSPKIRQILLHWGYELTKEDLDDYKKNK